ncbi:unnamed protein product [Didymodactylos carnosus]|uniref:Uncharacterized protein n=1 Tax=Didymodactylos carnosus TaxID=1234261 RepID=A0A8S2H7R2_9BILA|nr:unnamed protein product [Didymodactylos carnosus]CAF3606004.1 unnamed protein product [Didymodactylos carnosus]
MIHDLIYPGGKITQLVDWKLKQTPRCYLITKEQMRREEEEKKWTGDPVIAEEMRQQSSRAREEWLLRLLIMIGYKITCIPNQQTRGEVQTNLRLEFDSDPDNRMVYMIVAEVAATSTHSRHMIVQVIYKNEMVFDQNKLQKAFDFGGKITRKKIHFNWKFNQALRINRKVIEYGSLNDIPRHVEAPWKQEDGMDDSFLDQMDSKDLDAMDRTVKEALIASQQTIEDELDLSFRFLDELNDSGLAGPTTSETNDDQGNQTHDNVYSTVRELASTIVAECTERNSKSELTGNYWFVSKFQKLENKTTLTRLNKNYGIPKDVKKKNIKQLILKINLILRFRLEPPQTDIMFYEDYGIVLIKDGLLAEIDGVYQITATIPLTNYGCHVLTLKQSEELSICRDVFDNQNFDSLRQEPSDNVEEVLEQVTDDELQIVREHVTTNFIDDDKLMRNFAAMDPYNSRIFPLVKLAPSEKLENKNHRFPNVKEIGCGNKMSNNPLRYYDIGEQVVYDEKLYQVEKDVNCNRTCYALNPHLSYFHWRMIAICERFGALKHIFNHGIGLTNTYLHHRLAQSVEKIHAVVNTHQNVLKQHQTTLLSIIRDNLEITAVLSDFATDLNRLRDGIFKIFKNLERIDKTLSKHSRQMIREKMENSFLRIKSSVERIEKGDLNLDYLSVREQQKLVNIVVDSVKQQLSVEYQNMTRSGLANRLC